MKSINLKRSIGDDAFQKVAYIGLRNEDGSYILNVPLYVKVSEVTKNDLSISQEELIHKISEIMIKRYENQICNFINQARKKQKN